MKKKLYRQIAKKQRELQTTLRDAKAQVDRAIMLDLSRSYHALKELMLDRAGAHMVVCIHNALDDGETVNADAVAHFSEIVKKTLPFELHLAWSVFWKNKTRLALQSDFYQPGAIPLKEWGLIP